MGKFYEKYWEENTTHQRGDFDLKWPILSKCIPAVENITILDFGCGAGHILSEIKKINPEAKLMGLDVSQAALDEAKRLLSEVELHKIEDGGKFPLVDDSVDFIFTSEVIEHVYDTENAAKELYRILKPGGRMLLTTPYHNFIKNLLILLSGKFDTHFDPVGPHVRFFSKKTLWNLLEERGFKIENHGFYGRFWPISHSVYLSAVKPNEAFYESLKKGKGRIAIKIFKRLTWTSIALILFSVIFPPLSLVPYFVFIKILLFYSDMGIPVESSGGLFMDDPNKLGYILVFITIGIIFWGISKAFEIFIESRRDKL